MLAVEKASPFRTLVGGLQGMALGAVGGLLLAQALVAIFGAEGFWTRPVGEAGACGVAAGGAAAGLIVGAVLGATGAGMWVFVTWVNGMLLGCGLCWFLMHQFPGAAAILGGIREGPAPLARDMAGELAGGALLGGVAASFLGLGFWAGLLTLGGLALGIGVGTAVGGFPALVAGAVLGACGGADLGRMLFLFLERLKEKAEELMEQ